MKKQNQKGTVLVLVLLVVSVLMLSGVALMTKVLSASNVAGTGLHRVRALYIAEAGMERARWRLGIAADFSVPPPADALYTDEPFADGRYTVIISERSPTEATITSSGTYGSVTRTISVRVRQGTSWWDQAWLYRRSVIVSNGTASDLADYQVRIALPFEAGKINADGSDLRFLDENMTELSYWIEAIEAGSVVVWVNVPLIPGGGQVPVYEYYGNPAASAASDISTTMEADYIKYDIPATWTDRTSVASVATGDNVGAWVDMQFTFPYYQGTETRVYACSNGYLSFGSTYRNDTKNTSSRLRVRSMIAALWDDLRTNTIYGVCDDPGIYVDSYADRVLIDWEAFRNGLGPLDAAALFQVTLYRNGDILLSRGPATNDFLISETVGISRGGGGVYTEITPESQPDRSWLFAMRKYVQPEPSAAVGTEETPSPTIVIYWKEES